MPRPGGAWGTRGSFPGLPLPWALRTPSPWEGEGGGTSPPPLPLSGNHRARFTRARDPTEAGAEVGASPPLPPSPASPAEAGNARGIMGRPAAPPQGVRFRPGRTRPPPRPGGFGPFGPLEGARRAAPCPEPLTPAALGAPGDGGQSSVSSSSCYPLSTLRAPRRPEGRCSVVPAAAFRGRPRRDRGFPPPRGRRGNPGAVGLDPRAARRDGPNPAGSKLPAGRRARQTLRPRRGESPAGRLTGPVPRSGRRRRPKRRPDAGEASASPPPPPPAAARPGPDRDRGPRGGPLRPARGPSVRAPLPHAGGGHRGNLPRGSLGEPLAPSSREGPGDDRVRPLRTGRRPVGGRPPALPRCPSPRRPRGPRRREKQQGGGPRMSSQDTPGPPPCCPG
jgi:hypothetical protein